jgi:ribose transport system substrate-binding protein
MKVNRLLAALAAAAAMTGLAACGSTSEGSGGSSGTLTITPSKSVGETVGPHGERPTPTSDLKLTSAEVARIKAGHYTAALTWAAGGDVMTAVTAGAKDKFAELGIRVVATTESNFDTAKQKSDIETVLAKRPSVMLTLAADPVASASTYRAVADAGTRLVFLDNVPPGFTAGRDYVAIVTDNLFEMGKQAADALAAAIGGRGKIAYFFHDATFYVTNQRDQAFKKTIEENYPDIKIVAEQGIADINKGEELANAVLLKNPDLDGIYVTFSTPPGEGVLGALRNNGNTKTRVVSLDLAEPLALDMARGGNVAALVSGEAYESGQGLATAAAYGLLGKQAPPFIIEPPVTVTKANLADGYRRGVHIAPPQSVLDAAK